MLIDFCHHSLRPKIKSDKVTFDGYEVTNLISDDARLKTKGFISDHFVKPPVNVTVQFPCNISIYRVVIDPVIGQQKSCDLKLFTATYPALDPWLTGEQGSKQDRALKTDGLLFNFVGSSSQLAPALSCYQNNSFRDRGLWNRQDFESASSFPAYFELRARKPNHLFNVSHLSVNILRSKSGQSVAIKRLEVWGMPSRNVPDASQLMLRLAFQKGCGALTTSCASAQKNKVAKTNIDDSFKQKQKNNSVSNSILHGDVEVPEDFVDQITFDIMAVPMLLPCGKNVDQSTLERFVNIEASWGRHPSDPFTGVPLGQGHQAIPNAALKTRIDQFVMQHSDSLNVPRTLGKGDKKISDNFASSKITKLHPSDYQKNFEPSSQCRHKLEENKNNVVPLRTSGKRKSILENSSKWSGFEENKYFSEKLTSQMNPWKRHKSASHTSEVIDLTKDSEKYLCNSNTSEIRTARQDRLAIPTAVAINTAGKDHNKSLSNSLDSALLTTLTALPSFTKKKKQRNEKEDNSRVTEKSCCNCSTELDDVIYKLPCQHIICRQCIQKNTDCTKCCQQFNTRDIVRVFRT